MDQTPVGKILRGTLAGGMVRVLLCETTQMADAARAAHGASSVCAAALGRGISGAALLAASTEEETNSLTMTVAGGGPAGSLVVVAHGRRLKAYIGHPEATLPNREDGKLNVGGVVGREGRITVIRDLGLREPYIGQCSLASGEIAEDIAYYCTMSEQKPTLCALGVLVGKEGVLASGGLLVQPLPGCPEETLSQLELRAPIFADISAHLLEFSPELLFERFFDGLSPAILSAEALSYACDCSRAKMERVLISLGREELTDMMETEHGAEIVCNFCRKRHVFSEEELGLLLSSAGDVGDVDKGALNGE